MSDEPKSTLNEELRTLTNQPLEKLSLTDREGKEHLLASLSVNDMLEFEDRLGMSLLDAASKRMTLRHVITILWLAVRKAGLTREEIVKRKWKIATIEEFGELFDISILQKATVETIGKLMEQSGLKQKNPPMLVNPTDSKDKSVGMPATVSGQATQ